MKKDHVRRLTKMVLARLLLFAERGPDLLQRDRPLGFAAVVRILAAVGDGQVAAAVDAFRPECGVDASGLGFQNGGVLSAGPLPQPPELDAAGWLPPHACAGGMSLSWFVNPP